MDWGWRREGSVFVDQDGGNRVQYIGKPEQLRGIQDAGVYLGYGWNSQERLAEDLMDLVRRGAIEILAAPCPWESDDCPNR